VKESVGFVRGRKGVIGAMQDMFLRMLADAQNRYFEIKEGERGATAVEYGIMVALIAAVIILVVTAVGRKTSNAFESINANLK
jgi:pilus assembly protein Flp/PilA